MANYDQEAFTKAWDYLASSTSDGENDFFFFLFLFFVTFFSPRYRGEIPPFPDRLMFFRPLAHAGQCANEKKKEKLSTRKTPKISINLSLKTSDTVKGPCKRKRLY